MADAPLKLVAGVGGPGNLRIVSGSEELTRLLRELPQASATHLQAVVRKNFMDHKGEVIRSSTFKTIDRRSLWRLIHAWPKRYKARKSLSQVRGGSDVYWQGLGARSPAEGVAARIEKRIGTSVNRPLRARFLLIPQGDMLSPKGKPRRTAVGGEVKGVAVRALPGAPGNQNRRVGHKNVPLLQSGKLKNTYIRPTGKSGQLALYQKLDAGKRGVSEGVHYRSDGRRIDSRRLSARVRMLAVLKRTAKQAQPLDFFAAWDRLRASREARYDRMLGQIVSGRRPARVAA